MAISVEEALKIIEETKPLCGTEMVSVYECAGRICAEDLVSPVDQPPFPRSPLDGFAFRSVDVKGACRERPVRLQQVGYVPAGCGETLAVGPGQCVRIMTGGPIPADCDAVIGIEDAAYENTSECDGDAAVLIYREIAHHQNYVFAGEDFAKGSVLCRAGTKIDAALAGCLAAAGFADVPVCRKPGVSVVSTGSEVVRAGEPLAPGRIYDSNTVYLKNRLAQLGFEAESAFCPDDPALLMNALTERIGRFDLVITTGGVSVGDADYMPDVLAEMGADLRFQGAALKPGSPLMLAEKADTQILCLSGNPYAAAATFELFARPLLASLCADSFLKMRKTEGVLVEGFSKGSPVPRYLRARLEDGILYVPKAHSSGQLLAMSGCNCLAKLPAGPGPFEAGMKLETYLL
ncbi:MAG: molybdopterin molybdotransferase MoeA [Firmicutes bacterium]|nr:molybdopterin molybdotransferase MoeA [Bacillota bacterium]